MAAAHSCYFPNGSEATRDTPCHSSGVETSACCAYSDTCLDNRLCLAQQGAEIITRGSCTDETWQSPECPQYCADVNQGGGVNMHLVDSQNRVMYCCDQGLGPNVTCLIATQGSTEPFSVEAGLVIFNRTSGSTSPNATSIATVTVTVTATVNPTVLASKPSSAKTTSSSKRSVSVGAAISALLGIAFLVTFALLWREKRHKQSLRKDVETWKEKSKELMSTLTAACAGNEDIMPHPPLRQFDGWIPKKIGGQPDLSHQRGGWISNETDGTQIYEMANMTVQA